MKNKRICREPKMILKLILTTLIFYLFLITSPTVHYKSDAAIGLSLDGPATLPCFTNEQSMQFESFTVCTFFRLRKSLVRASYVISFRQKGFYFQMGIGPMGVIFLILEHKSRQMYSPTVDFNGTTTTEYLFEVPTPPNEWIHVCIHYDAKSEEVICIFDEETEKISYKKRISNKYNEIIYKPTLCIGDDSFKGDIVDLQIRSHVSADELLSLRKSSMCTGNGSYDAYFDFTDLQWSHSKNITLTNYSLEQLCLSKKTMILIDPAGSFQQAHQSCASMNGNLLAEYGSTEALLFTQRSSENGCMSQEKIISWIFSSNYFNETDNFSAKCMAVNVNGEPMFISCVRWLPCSICYVTPKRFTLYGHEGNHYEYMYYQRTNDFGQSYWIGIGGSLIDRKNDSWVLSSSLHSIQWILHEVALPIGRFDWLTDHGTKKLFFSTCKTWQFGCDDGMCIDQSLRCDEVIDCQDRSDEENCKVLYQPEGYDPLREPPPRENEVLPLYLYYHVNVYNLAQITTTEGEARMDMGITMSWFDPRIKLYNLKQGKKNYFSCSSVWLPTVRAISGDGEGSFLETNQYQKDCFAFPENETEDRSLTDPYMAHTVDGNRHRLVYYLGQLASVPCSFTLYNYPFDVQLCNISFFVMNAPGNLVLRKDSPGNEVPYLNKQKDLLEYELVSLTTKVGFFIQDGDNFTYLVLTMDLQRLYGYHITNSFFPSLLMMIIAYTTYFFQLHDFTNRIMIALTAQLVLAALFTSTTESSVKTPYLKLIDVWYACIITFCSLITVSQVYINVLYNSVDIPWFLSKVLFYTEGGLRKPRTNKGNLFKEIDNKTGQNAAKIFNKFSYLAIISIVVIFIVIYGLLSLRKN